MNDEGIRVSVICNAYNHSLYIRECLESLVKQKTDFLYEILVHDDASTDNTAEIIREYEHNYPHLIKPIYQEVNQYNNNGLLKYQYARVKGKYIAICEGDDFWTDTNKLQTQYDILEKNPDIDICSHKAVVIDAKTNEGIGYLSPSEKDTIFSPEEVILGEGGFVATNSLMYRADLEKEVPEFRRFLRMDYTIQIQGALRGGMLYIAKTMSAYRRNVPGSWTDLTCKDRNKWTEFVKKKQKMLKLLDRDTYYIYHKSIQERMMRNAFEYYIQNEKYKYAYRPQYVKFRKELSMKQRIKIRLKKDMPFLVDIKRMMMRILERGE